VKACHESLQKCFVVLTMERILGVTSSNSND